MRQDAGRPLADRGAAAQVGPPPVAGRPSGRKLLLAGAALALTFAGCAEKLDRIPARGEVAGAAIETTVDAEVARYYLESYLPGQRTRPELDRALEASFGELPEEPTAAAYRRLAIRFSSDLASLHLIEALAARPANARAQARFRSELARLGALNDAGRRACVAAFELPEILFAPGWLYRSQLGTGADFARQRALLARLEVESRLLPVIENGTVEANARIIAEQIRGRAAGARPVILVSASKGGPEVAHALGAVLRPEETAAILAWVNVGGLLKGAPLADWASVWPRRWLARLYYWWQGLDPADSIESLTTERSRARFESERIPGHVLILNFVGIPLAGDLSPGAEFGYRRTLASGPNDGLTPIVDEIAHGGLTIVAPGLDHYYRDPELDLKTLALALTVVLELGRPVPASCQARAGAAAPSAAIAAAS